MTEPIERPLPIGPQGTAVPPFAPDLEPPPSRRRRWFIVATLLVVGLAGIAVVAVNLHERAHSGRSRLPAGFDPQAESQQALDALRDHLTEADRAAFLGSWAPTVDAQDQAVMLYDNLTDLRVRLRLGVYLTSELTAAQSPVKTPAWDAFVNLGWRLNGVDEAAADAGLNITFTLMDDHVQVVSVEPDELRRTPIWLTGELSVVRGRNSMVAAAEHDLAAGLLREVEIGRRQVARTVGTAGDTTVAYLPQDIKAYATLLHGRPRAYDQIAAVSTTVDGTRLNAPRMIAVNPEAYDAMGRLGRQLVITHEITHIATESTYHTPAWLREGFADYVGIRFAGLPVQEVAADALGWVARHGAPHALPSEHDFGFKAPDLERAYELSWLAVRMLAEEYGNDAVVAFYTDVVTSNDGVGTGLRSNLDTSLRAVTAEWRRYLEDLADAA